MSKTYKVRVEVGAILEIDVVAGDEEEAESIAKDIAFDQARHLECNEFGDRDEDIYLASWGVGVSDAEEVDYE